ncbi:RagB/SusD family nutrient uptake outer membrane protein [Sinomicrobium kalidii]|uniref:RagB/SusD family nutrient uptake outer membrane protein n=1 Tax=Sinomicrobium kalidii TaxID=2900738 RepID=UPI001E609340|nr:RagB/SusD family nutrient uptake outer membrane protein [Sinomicrobium kalidii]UGU14425.1 RagB/SusD family nutrient uptake outer membrane protein [Sinomicrobium kalidii]
MMKKNKINLWLFFLPIILLSSCDNELDQSPFDSLQTDKAFITASDFENGIRGAYFALTLGGYYGSADQGSMLSMPDVLSDNVIMTQRGRFTKRNLHEFTYTQASTITSFYNDAYNVIYSANQVLYYLDMNDFQGPSRENIKAEALALRAFAHFDLVRVYGKIPTQSSDANASLGVGYVTEPDPWVTPSRLTVAETYDAILEDLLEAYDKIDSDNGIGRFNKETVALLLSRVYLYMGGEENYQKCVDYANEVTTPIASREDVKEIWTDEKDSGLLFYITNLAGAGELNNQIGITWGQGPVDGIVPEYAVTFEFMNKFSEDDIRRESYTHTVSGSGQTYNGIKKLFGKPGQFNGIVNYKILRAEEALLNKTEALFFLGREAEALNALNQLRDERYTSYSGGESGNGLLEAIKLERRLEFAFEYQRFFDLKRWGDDMIRQATGDLVDGSGTPSAALSLEAGDHKWQLPFFQQMLARNPNLVQNPGY